MIAQLQPYNIIPKKTEKHNGSYKINSLSINGENIDIGRGEFMKSAMLFLEQNTTCSISAMDETFFGYYESNQDSLKINLEKEFLNIKSINAKFFKNCIIKGRTDNNKDIQISLELVKDGIFY